MIRAILTRLGFLARVPDDAPAIVVPPPRAVTKDSWEGYYSWHGDNDLPVILEAEIR